jgi:hypothetical protein
MSNRASVPYDNYTERTVTRRLRILYTPGRDERHDTLRSTASNSFSHLPVGCGDAERKFDLEQPRVVALDCLCPETPPSPGTRKI